MSDAVQTHRTRFVCVSDTHNTYPKLPKGDILIHAGDLTNQGRLAELQKTIDWIEKADFEVKIVIAGNHDVTLDPDFYAQYGTYFHHKDMQDPSTCMSLLTDSPSITYLNHEARVIRLTNPDGPRTTFKIFGSPYSPSRGLWAFGYAPEDAVALWDHVPLDSDVVVTHTPAKFHRDECGTRGSAGCDALRQALWRIRPRLAICGHIHEARGAEIVRWDLELPNVRYKELETMPLTDVAEENSRKQFRIDLTTKSQRPLQNDGGCGDSLYLTRRESRRGMEVALSGDASLDDPDVAPGSALPPPRRRPKPPFPLFESAERPISPEPKPSTAQADHLATRGQGGPSSSPRCDQEALSGRSGRTETCIINAAILTSNWPHKAGKKFSKPIVVDIDLPVALDLDVQDGNGTDDMQT